MQIILASAKIMNDRLKSVPDISLSTPRFLNEAEAFAREMADIMKVMDAGRHPHTLRSGCTGTGGW